ncbi:hypothetical protein GDN83_21705 [Gordonia jinghuaiqii]|nr:hypothetical protein [Gordonia jinghuaiqii]
MSALRSIKSEKESQKSLHRATAGKQQKPVTLSRRDLATSMMTVSDNVAADVLLTEIGLDTVIDDLAELGLTETRIVGGVAELHDRLRRETGRAHHGDPGFHRRSPQPTSQRARGNRSHAVVRAGTAIPVGGGHVRGLPAVFRGDSADQWLHREVRRLRRRGR